MSVFNNYKTHREIGNTPYLGGKGQQKLSEEAQMFNLLDKDLKLAIVSVKN